MFVRTIKSVLATASLASLFATTGCLTDVLAPASQDERAHADSVFQDVTEKIRPIDLAIEPCAPSPDLVPDGRIDSSDLAVFAARYGHQDAGLDFTQNGRVDDRDRQVIEYFMGRDYTHDCLGKATLPADCYPFANPDFDGNGWIDSSDLAAFHAMQGDASRTDFNGDGVVDTLDRIIVEERLGRAFTTPPCTTRPVPCDYPTPDLDGDGWVTSSDLVAFAAARGTLAADITGNGAVNENDLKVIEALLGQPYESTCELPKWMIASDCHPYASPDMNASGSIDSSDLVFFYSGSATLAQADFNGDGVVDTFDAVILLDRFGSAYTTPSCSRPSRRQRQEM